MKYSDYTRSELKMSVSRLLRRLRFTLPYPFEEIDPVQLYYNLIDPKGIAALHTLAVDKQLRGFLEYGQTGTVWVHLPEDKSAAITYHFGKAIPTCEPGYQKNGTRLYAYADSPHLQQVTEWATQALDVEATIARVENFCSHIIQHCNTPGQVVRCIPSLASIAMTLEEREQVAAMKRKAPYPKHLARNEEFFKLRREAEDILVRCLLMPDTGNRVPKIWAG